MSTHKNDWKHSLNYLGCLLLIVVLNTTIEIKIHGKHGKCPIKKIFDCGIDIRVIFKPNKGFKETS